MTLDGFSTPASSITIVATDADGSITEIALDPTVDTFRGFISDGNLVSLSFLIGDEEGVWPSLDNLHLGTVVDGPVIPEPATWALMIAGFGLVGGAMRRASRSPLKQTRPDCEGAAPRGRPFSFARSHG